MPKLPKQPPRFQPSTSQLSFVILAGGQGTRMGGVNKGLIDWHGRALIAHLLDWIQAEQATFNCPTDIIIVTNDRLDEYQAVMLGYSHLNLSLVSDRYAGFLGPLAGIDAALAVSQAPWLQLLPCDCPCPPPGLVTRLMQAKKAESTIIIPQDAERVQPLFAQVSTDLKPLVTEALEQRHLAVYRWMQQQTHQLIDVADLSAHFNNINSPQR